MREYDVTPKEQGSDCIYQRTCQYYKYGIWCNICTFRYSYEELEDDCEDELY